MNTLPDAVSYINGAYLVPNAAATKYDVINPATNEVMCQFYGAMPDDVDCAVDAANAAFKEWSEMTGAKRGEILRKAASLLRENRDELARLEVLDTGKPISEAICVDIDSGADCLDYFAGVAPTIAGEQFDFGYTRREALGVCAGIGAWNYPIQIACWKAAPALACGNTMVFKPSEMTVLTTLRLAEIFSQAGLPNGVFNVVLGAGDVGQQLAEHDKIAKLSLTGSVETGKKVMGLAASTIKPVTMELGGKSPLIIFEDADIKNAVSAAMLGNFYTQGEICSNATRIFVHEKIYDAFMNELVPRTEKIIVGDPLDEKTQMGSLISGAHKKRVLNYISLGQKEGATLVTGGMAVGNQGNFVAPTIFTDCTDDMTIVREEIFGPVMSVLKFSDENEVVARANNTVFGLGAGVFTKNLTRAHRVIAQLQAGTCWINTYNMTPVEMPFGGVKQSGVGRENGLAAIEHYTQIKSVYVETGDVDSPF